MRKMLIKYIKQSLMEHIGKSCMLAENIADDIIANGGIVPPFRLGQKVWYISRPRRKENIFSAKVIYITHTDMGFIISVEIENGHRFEMDAEDLYSSREEAEQALKEREL